MYNIRISFTDLLLYIFLRFKQKNTYYTKRSILCQTVLNFFEPTKPFYRPSLLKKKYFEIITVQDILGETPVTRATFYAHYHDKYELVEKMLDQFLIGQGTAKDKIDEAFPEGF